MRVTRSVVLSALTIVLGGCLPRGLILPQSPALRWLERRTGTIAYVGLDGNVRTMDQGGGSQREVTADAAVGDTSTGLLFYLYPVWSPDAKRLAFVRLRKTGGSSGVYGVWEASTDGRSRARLFESGARIPRLLSWSPDSTRIVFVSASGDDGQELDAVAASGGGVQVLDRGSAFAWRWGRSSSALAVHAGGDPAGGFRERVAIFDPRGIAGEKDLPLTPGLFDAPAVLADDEGIIVMVDGGDGPMIYMANRSGTSGRKIAGVKGGVTLDLSPDGRHLAWSAQVRAGPDSGSRLYVVDVPATRRGPLPLTAPRAVSGDDFVVAFFWSPDGSRIAYFVPSPGAGAGGTEIALTLKVLDVSTGRVRTVAHFQPSPYFMGILRDFGQYGESVRLWSPDGNLLLYCALDSGTPGIMIAYADAPIAPRRIADGLMATWSRR